MDFLAEHAALTAPLRSQLSQIVAYGLKSQLPITSKIVDGNIYETSVSYAIQTLAGNAETTYQNSIDMTKDFILYTRMKLTDNNDYMNFNFGIAGTLQFQLSVGYGWATSAKDGCSISIHDAINSSNTNLGSMDMYTTAHDLIVWYDHKWGYLNVYIDNVLIGSWKPTAGANLAGVTRVYGKAGSTSTLVTLDYLYIGIPLVTSIGDSIAGGAILHAANPEQYAGVDTYANSYHKLISDYLKLIGIRNYFVVNKAVNGETSDTILARFAADIVATGCKFVLIQGGINDYTTHAEENTTIQNKIDMANAAIIGNITPLIVGTIPTQLASEAHGWSIILHLKENQSYRAYFYVDVWKAVEGTTPYVADDAKMSDGAHPNASGYSAMSDEICEYINI